MVSLKQNCGSCEWWWHNPVHPDKSLGLCTEDTRGIVTSDSPTTRRADKCKKWSDYEENNIEVLAVRRIVPNLAPEGCATCPKRLRAYKTEICLVSYYLSLDKLHLHYRRTSLMTTAMCRFGKRLDAAKRCVNAES